MDANALLYYTSARALKLPAQTIPQIEGFNLKLGNFRYYFQSGETPFNSGSSIGIASNKFSMNKILEANGIPVPNARSYSKKIFESEPIESLIHEMKFPLVVKPTSGTVDGKDVLCNIQTIDQLKNYLRKCYQHHPYLTIEEFHAGLTSYRVLVFFNKIIGITQRIPASITGDGTHNIRELIELENEKRVILNITTDLGPIIIDEECNIRLKELNITTESIPANHEIIMLCYTSNSGRGGSELSLKNNACKENARLFSKAAKALGLNLVGFDVQCENLLIPIEKSNGVIIEANHNPDICMHEKPMSGPPNPVSKRMLVKLILKHPIDYLIALYQNKTSSLYLKSSIVLIIFAVTKTLITV